MLFHVCMKVQLPHDLPSELAAQLKENERELALRLQRSGKWRHLWRVTGRYENISVFDVDSPDELNSILFSLPLFPFMQIDITSLCRHPSTVEANLQETRKQREE